MKVLVLGGAGFIGYHLSRRMADAGHEVTILDDLSRGEMDTGLKELLERGNVDLLEADVTASNSLVGLDMDFDKVYHLAAVNGTRHFYNRPYEVMRTNILALLNVLDWMACSGSGKLVWCSSSEVYSGTARITKMPIPTTEDVPVAIDDITNPRFSYAASKIAGELLCLNFSRAHDIEVAVIRPHNVYGPRMGSDHVIPEFIERILKKEDPFRIYGGDQTRSFCYIDDFVDGLVRAGDSREANGEVINLGDDREEIEIKDLAEKLFDLVDYHPELEILPPPEGSVERRCPDISKARRILGYEPRAGFNEGLKETLGWYRKKEALI